MKGYRVLIALIVTGAVVGVAYAAAAKPKPAPIEVVRRIGPAQSLPPGGFVGMRSTCLSGEVVVGRGWAGGNEAVVITGSFPFVDTQGTTAGLNGWEVVAHNSHPTFMIEAMHAFALCTKGSITTSVQD